MTITEFINVSEDNETARVCVSLGITGGIAATLSITLQINDGKAGQNVEFSHGTNYIGLV